MAGRSATAEDGKIGARVAALRKVKGLSQTALGDAIGVTFQQVQKYETGRNRIGASRLQDISKSLGVSVSLLYGDEGKETEENELLVLCSNRGAAELLEAFASIENAALRCNVLAIVNTAARISVNPVAVIG